MARPFSYHILTPAMLPGWSLFYVHTCIPSLSPLNHNNSSTSKNQWMILVLFFLLVVSGLYLKKTLPPAFLQKKTSKKLIRLSRTPTPPRKRRTKRTFDSCFCAALRLPPWIEGSKASSLRMENEAIRYTQVFFWRSRNQVTCNLQSIIL